MVHSKRGLGFTGNVVRDPVAARSETRFAIESVGTDGLEEGKTASFRSAPFSTIVETN